MNIEQKKMNDQLSKELQAYDWLENDYIIGLGDTNETVSKLIKNVDWFLSFPENEKQGCFEIYSCEIFESVLKTSNINKIIEYVKENAQNFNWIK